jgi:menaquinone-dependent protoporphyrinogen oxidase
MNVLVAYASKRGSTAEIAEAIADKLRECGLGVDCRPAGDVDTLEPYGAVVLGSAVYARHWAGEARRFLRRHAEELCGRPLWVFSSGPAGEPGKALDRVPAEPARIVERLERLGVREHVVFGGRLLAQPKNRLERSLVERTPFGYRDRRDWRKIRGWASGIAAELGAERPASLAPDLAVRGCSPRRGVSACPD